MTKYIIPILALILCISCSKEDVDNISPNQEDYKESMREFVISISSYAKKIKSTFSIIPQNGIELITKDGESNGQLHQAYLDAIDGHGQEDLFYGYDEDNKATNSEQTKYLKDFLTRSKSAGNQILVTDYCSNSAFISNSNTWNKAAGFISYAAEKRELDEIPTRKPNQENAEDIQNLSMVKNFLYFINPSGINTKSDFINQINKTNYDLLIIDYYFAGTEAFTANEINQLKKKANGGKRLVISYMSIGEAEDYRPYWKNSWTNQKPDWIAAENPDWKGNYKVKYWNQEWQSIIYGTDDSYVKKILDSNFDGVYLDIIDAFEYFENN